jgi:hypothetical protein
VFTRMIYSFCARAESDLRTDRVFRHAALSIPFWKRNVEYPMAIADQS